MNRSIWMTSCSSSQIVYKYIVVLFLVKSSVMNTEKFAFRLLLFLWWICSKKLYFEYSFLKTCLFCNSFWHTCELHNNSFYPLYNNQWTIYFSLCIALSRFYDWKVKKYEHFNLNQTPHKHKWCLCDHNWSWSLKRDTYKSKTEDECDDLMQMNIEFKDVKTAIRKLHYANKHSTEHLWHDESSFENMQSRTTRKQWWLQTYQTNWQSLNTATSIILFASDLLSRLIRCIKVNIESHASADNSS